MRGGRPLQRHRQPRPVVQAHEGRSCQDNPPRYSHAGGSQQANKEVEEKRQEQPGYYVAGIRHQFEDASAQQEHNTQHEGF